MTDDSKTMISVDVYGWHTDNQSQPRGKQSHPVIHHDSPRSLVELLENSPNQELTPSLENLLSDLSLVDTKDGAKSVWTKLKNVGMVDAKANDIQLFVEGKNALALFFRLLKIRAQWLAKQEVRERKARSAVDPILKHLCAAVDLMRQSDLDVDEQIPAMLAREKLFSESRLFGLTFVRTMQETHRARIEKIENLNHSSETGMKEIRQIVGSEPLLMLNWDNVPTQHPTLADVIDQYIQMLDPTIMRKPGDTYIKLHNTKSSDGEIQFFCVELTAYFRSTYDQRPMHGVVATLINAFLDIDSRNDRKLLDAEGVKDIEKSYKAHKKCNRD